MDPLNATGRSISSAEVTIEEAKSGKVTLATDIPAFSSAPVQGADCSRAPAADVAPTHEASSSAGRGS